MHEMALAEGVLQIVLAVNASGLHSQEHSCVNRNC
jgi:hypothetical protein